MSLSNLQAIGRLHAQPPDAAAIGKLLQSARQNLADARVEIPSLAFGAVLDATGHAGLTTSPPAGRRAGAGSPGGPRGGPPTSARAATRRRS